MRIQAIYARNFLSFTDLAITGLGEFNAFVGPNGSGKTNVLRILQHLRDALNGQSDLPYASYVHAKVPDQGYQIAIDVAWTAEDERSLLTAYFATILQQQRAIRDLTNDEGSANEDAVAAWCHQVDAMLSRDAMQPLYTGRLALNWTPSALTHHQIHASYCFMVQGNPLYWWLGLNSANCVATEDASLNTPPQISQSLPKRWATADPDRSKRLVELFQGRQTDWASLHWDWAEIYDDLSKTSTPLATMSLDLQSDDTRDYDRPSRKRVLTAMNMSPTGPIRVITGAQVMSALLRTALAVSPNRRSAPESWVSWESLHTKGAAFENAADLPRVLYILKNGSPDARGTFETIREAFQTLTQKRLDVQAMPRLAEATVQSDPKIGMEIWLQVSDQISNEQPTPIWVLLDHAGTGIEEALYWVTLAYEQDRHVVALDEPGANLHPDLQIRLRQYFQQSPSQVFIITHSPYMISADHLENTFRVAQNQGESRIWSGALIPTTRQRSKATRLRDSVSRSADMRALLFASRVLLVEGESEAAALPIWLGKAKRPKVHTFGEANVVIQWIGGKGNAMHYLPFLEAFGIAWRYLCDGDALTSKGGDVWAALRRVKIKVPQTLRQNDFSQKKGWLRAHGVWVRGDTPTDCFETLPEYQRIAPKIPPDYGSSKVLRGQWVAENTDCPQEIEEFFAWLFASGVSG